MSESSLLVNNVNSPVARSAIVSPIAAGAGHVAAGTTAGLVDGQGIKNSFINSFDGIGQSMAIGGAIGVSSTIGTCYANKICPWTGKTSIFNKTTDFFEGTNYSSKVQRQMYEDSFHGFPESVKAFQQYGYTKLIIGGDGIVRIELHILYLCILVLRFTWPLYLGV